MLLGVDTFMRSKKSSLPPGFHLKKRFDNPISGSVFVRGRGVRRKCSLNVTEYYRMVSRLFLVLREG